MDTFPNKVLGFRSKNSLERENNYLRDLIEKLRRDKTKFKNSYENQKKQLRSAEEKVQSLNTKIKNYEAEISGQNKEIESLKSMQFETNLEKDSEVQNKVEELDIELEQLRQKCDELSDENTVLIKSLEELRKEIPTLKSEISFQKTKYYKKCKEVKQLQKASSKEREKIQQQNIEIIDLRKTMASLNTELENAKSSNEEDIHESKNAISKLQIELEAKSSQITRWRNHAKALLARRNASLKQHRKLLSNCNHEKEELRQSLEKSNSELAIKLQNNETKLKILETEREEMFGFVQWVKETSHYQIAHINDNLSRLLEELKAHLEVKLGMLQKICDLVSDCTTPSSTATTTTLSGKQDPSLSAFLPPVNRQPTPATELTQSDPLYEEIMSNVESTIPMLSSSLEYQPPRKRPRNTPLARNFQCQVCPKAFLRFGHLKRHLAEVHCMPNALSQIKASCSVCGKLFKTKTEFEKHNHVRNSNDGKCVDGQTSQLISMLCTGTMIPKQQTSPTKTLNVSLQLSKNLN